MPTSNGPDPRFNGKVLTYNPEVIKNALSTYYHALSKLPYIEESDINIPPKNGWPNTNASNFDPLGKDASVIELLKHLPYLRNPGLPKGYTITFSTFVIDYSAAPPTEPLDVDGAEQLSPDLYEDDEEKIKSWVIPFTMSEDPTVTEWAQNDSMESEVDYEPDDPRAWRNTCGETRLLEELLTDGGRSSKACTGLRLSRKSETTRNMPRTMGNCKRSSETMDGHTISGGSCVRKPCWRGMRNIRITHIQLRLEELWPMAGLNVWQSLSQTCESPVAKPYLVDSAAHPEPDAIVLPSHVVEALGEQVAVAPKSMDINEGAYT